MYGRQISKCCEAHISNIHKCTPKQTEPLPPKYLCTIAVASWVSSFKCVKLLFLPTTNIWLNYTQRNLSMKFWSDVLLGGRAILYTGKYGTCSWQLLIGSLPSPAGMSLPCAIYEIQAQWNCPVCNKRKHKKNYLPRPDRVNCSQLLLVPISSPALKTCLSQCSSVFSSPLSHWFSRMCGTVFHVHVYRVCKHFFTEIKFSGSPYSCPLLPPPLAQFFIVLVFFFHVFIVLNSAQVCALNQTESHPRWLYQTYDHA